MGSLVDYVDVWSHSAGVFDFKEVVIGRWIMFVCDLTRKGNGP